MILLGDAEGVAIADVGEGLQWEEPGWSSEGAGYPGVLIWRRGECGLGAGGEESGGEDSAAVE